MDADSEARAADALAALVAAARLGGEAALRHFRPGKPTRAAISYKAGDSPVTAADLEVDALLAERLRPAFPDAGWLSEESDDAPARLGKSQLLVLDPIDGTRAFMSGDPCWTVAIALVEDGRPVAGVVHAPALGETFAASRGRGATLNGAPIRAANGPFARVVAAGPRTLLHAFAAKAGFEPQAAPRTPSLAYRFAAVAAGRIAIGVAGADSRDWDIAAAHAILVEAGALLVEAGGEVRYNQPRPRHGPLLAAPAEWRTRLAPAFAAAAPPA